MRRIRRGWRIAGAAVFVLLAAAGVLLYRPDLFWRLPALHGSAWAATAPSSLILDQDGRLLYEIIDPHGGMSRPMALGEIPLALRQAIIATEDASFYRNPGVDLRAVARALWANLRSGEIVSGGSTITQQVARNLLMAPDERTERTWQRKVREAWLAYALTRSLSKDEILTLYLNETYFGNMALRRGGRRPALFRQAGGAARPGRCALLAGLPQSLRRLRSA
jgi:membrane peptidoglycan carboxypeptidase